MNTGSVEPGAVEPGAFDQVWVGDVMGFWFDELLQTHWFGKDDDFDARAHVADTLARDIARYTCSARWD